MTSLADILYGNIPTEADYLRDDPFYRSGLGISQIQTAPPRNNTEAFLVPFLQNAVAGGLAGYGRSNAAQSAFTDARTSLAPLLSQVGAAQQANPDFAVPASIAPFLSETMPEDFKIKDALQSRAMAQYQQQITQEVAAKRQELVDKAAVEGGQPFLDAVKKKAQMEAQGTALGKREGEGLGGGLPTKDVPAALLGEIADSKAIVDEARSLGGVLKQSKMSWADLRGAEMFSGLDEDGITSRMADLADRALRLRTGAAAPEYEKADMRRIQSGDKTVSPQRAGELLMKFAEREAASAKSKAELVGATELASKFNAEAPIFTKTLKDGRTVRVRSIGNGQYEQVE